MTTVIIVEDNTYMRQHFEKMFADDPRYRVVGVFQDAIEAVDACRGGSVDLVLMDVLTLHDHSGIAAGKRIKDSGCRSKVVAVTSLIDPEVLAQARAGGADSLWYKDHGDADLMEVIERTLAGEHIFPDTSPDVELKDIRSAQLTPRQLEILRLFSDGLGYDEIAERVHLTSRGVRWNLDEIVSRSGFKNKNALLTAIIQKTLIVKFEDEE